MIQISTTSISVVICLQVTGFVLGQQSQRATDQDDRGPAIAIPAGWCMVQQRGNQSIELTFHGDDISFLTPEVELLLKHPEVRDACEVLPAQVAEFEAIQSDFEKRQMELAKEAINKGIMSPRAMEKELRQLADEVKERTRQAIPPHQADKLDQIQRQNRLIQLGYPSLLDQLQGAKDFKFSVNQRKEFDNAIKELKQSMEKEFHEIASAAIDDLAKILASDDEQVRSLIAFIRESLPPTAEVFELGLPLPTGEENQLDENDELAVFRYERELSPTGKIVLVPSARSFARDLIQELAWDKDLGLTAHQSGHFIATFRNKENSRAAQFERMENDLQAITQNVFSGTISQDDAKQAMAKKYIDIDQFIMREFRNELLDFQREKLDKALLRLEVREFGFVGSLFHGTLKRRIKLSNEQKAALDKWCDSTRHQIDERCRQWHKAIDEKLIPLFTDPQRQMLEKELGPLSMGEVSANCPQFLLMDRRMQRAQPN